MRLIQSMKEAELQGVELPTWYIMEFKAGDAGLRPSHPMSEEREVEKHEEMTITIASKLPECAFWNLLDVRDEEGVRFLLVVEWLRFIQSRSQVDQEWMQQS